MTAHDRTSPPDVEAAGRALADRLKREALDELPILLARWEAATETASAAA